MAGNVTPIRSEGQIRYRLAGAVDLDDAQVAYRLGQQTDARWVMWIGAGATAEAVGVTPGATVTGADAARVHALLSGVNPVDGEVLVRPKVAVAEEAKLDAVAGRIWNETVALLGQAVTDLVNILEPDMVVLGGGVTRSGAQLLDPVRELVATTAMAPAAAAARIELAALGDVVCVVGAGELALDLVGQPD